MSHRSSEYLVHAVFTESVTRNSAVADKLHVTRFLYDNTDSNRQIRSRFSLPTKFDNRVENNGCQNCRGNLDQAKPFVINIARPHAKLCREGY